MTYTNTCRSNDSNASPPQILAQLRSEGRTT
jgi:hypothetical protein